jgi:3-dehydroquinate dehydratase-1
MKRPDICVVITGNDFEKAAALTPYADLFEVRIDLTGDGWQDWAGRLPRPWIACNRLQQEGGRWTGSEESRLAGLMEAARLGASFIDIELCTVNLAAAVAGIKNSGAGCLISAHNLKETPPLDDLKMIVRHQLAAGADVCKVVTLANRPEDNATVIGLFKEFPGVKLVAFAMGQQGLVSRVMAPLAGGYFTYAAATAGAESAAGQLPADSLKSIYAAVGFD